MNVHEHSTLNILYIPIIISFSKRESEDKMTTVLSVLPHIHIYMYSCMYTHIYLLHAISRSVSKFYLNISSHISQGRKRFCWLTMLISGHKGHRCLVFEGHTWTFRHAGLWVQIETLHISTRSLSFVIVQVIQFNVKTNTHHAKIKGTAAHTKKPFHGIETPA